MYKNGINSMRKTIIGVFLILFFSMPAHAYKQANYTVLNSKHYRQVVNDSRNKIHNLIHLLEPARQLSLNTQVALISQQLADIPYSESQTIGEGDWQPNSTTYKPGAVHIMQDPVYRLDYLDCQSFVTVAMALLHAKSLDEFDRNYLKISYGAAGNPDGEIVHYYNRNNFVDADLNPINQRNGWLTDITSQGELSEYAKITTANINRNEWFLTQQQKHLRENVRVLSAKNGPAMVKRFKTVYANLNFQPEQVSISYIPKNTLALLQPDGSYQPNATVLDNIPTPAVAEIITDTKKWFSGGINIKNLVGTDFNVSHFGLLYRQKFHNGELIYHKISCGDLQQKRVCFVSPVICQKEQCDELMFANATAAYPNGFYWYQTSKGDYVCSSTPPKNRNKLTYCNRVEQLPLFAYLTDYQYGRFGHMRNPAFLGIHIETLN